MKLTITTIIEDDEHGSTLGGRDSDGNLVTLKLTKTGRMGRAAGVDKLVALVRDGKEVDIEVEA